MFMDERRGFGEFRMVCQNERDPLIDFSGFISEECIARNLSRSIKCGGDGVFSITRCSRWLERSSRCC